MRGTHEGLLRRLRWGDGALPAAADEAVCRRAPLAFVDSAAELWGALTRGYQVRAIVDDPAGPYRLHASAAAMAAAGITRLSTLPTLLRATLRDWAAWPSLRTVTCSGEPAAATLAAEFAAKSPHARLLNLWGATEVAGDAVACVLHGSANDHVRHAAAHAIGWPIAGARTYVIDAADTNGLRRLPLGDGLVQGELCVSGPGVAAAPHHGDSFLPNPWSGGDAAHAVLWRSGDIVSSHTEGGALEYVGRANTRSVKIGGVLVAVAAVEAAAAEALEAPGQLAVVAAALSGEDGDDALPTHLVAFVEARVLARKGIDANAARQVLAAALDVPAHRPAVVLPLAALPRTASGKVDRPALRARLSAEAAARTAEAPPADVEAAAWAVLAQALPAGISCESDTFYEAGGTSLLAIEAAWRLSVATGRSVPIELLRLPLGELRLAVAALPAATSDRRKGALSDAASSDTPPAMSDRPKRSLSDAASSAADASGDSARRRTEPQVSSDWAGAAGTGTARRSGDPKPSVAIAARHIATLGGCVDAPPLVAGGLVYAASHAGDVVCVSAAGGGDAVEWRVFPFGTGHVHIQAGLALVPSAKAVIVAGYVARDIDGDRPGGTAPDAEGGLVCALCAASGAPLWAAATAVPAAVKSTPLVVGQRVLAGCGNGAVYGIDATDGAVAWEHHCGGGGVFASPVLVAGGSCVVVTTAGRVLRLDGVAGARPRTAWTSLAEASTPFFGGPTLSGAVVCAAGVDGAAYGFDVATGKPLWRTPLSAHPIFSSCCALSGARFALGAHDGTLRCVSARDGRVLWRVDCGAAIYGSPTTDGAGTCVAVTTAGRVVAVRDADGSLRAEVVRVLPAEVFSDPVFGVESADVGAVFVGCRDDRMWRVDMTPW